MNGQLALSSRTMQASVATMVLTSIHHAYGAVAFSTPWRLHVVGVAIVAVALLAGLLALRKRARHASLAERAAFWGYAGLNLLFPVLAIGAFEGFYNHGVKNLLYYGGASWELFNSLFPPPAYEPPTNFFFEFTGVLQVVPAALAAIYLTREIIRRRHA